MDKASLLSDDVSYIKEQKSKVEELDALTDRSYRETKKVKTEIAESQSTTTTVDQLDPLPPPLFLELEVKIVGGDGMIRVQSENSNYPAAHLMNAIADLELSLHHASMSCMNEVMLQDVVIRLPHGLKTENALRYALHRRLDHQ